MDSFPRSASPTLAHVIDGKGLAAGLCGRVGQFVSRVRERVGKAPGLAVILVGDEPASLVYVKSKISKAKEVGLNSLDFHLPKTATQGELLQLIETLNVRGDVHGILLQLPLPAGLDESSAILAIRPEKDVDGLHPLNAGLLCDAPRSVPVPSVVPCTPLGCVMLVQFALARQSLSGLHAVVIGRSRLVGRPLAQLFLNYDATVTIAHSKTPHLEEVARQGDILAVAVGRPMMVGADHIKEGAVVIDIGISREPVPGKEGKSVLVGDVDFGAASRKAGFLTPVPGGVGPMTIACLMYNAVRAFCRLEGIVFDFRLQFDHS